MGMGMGIGIAPPAPSPPGSKTSASERPPGRAPGGTTKKPGEAAPEPTPEPAAEDAAPGFLGGAAGFLDKPDGAKPLYPERQPRAAAAGARAERAPQHSLSNLAPTPAGAGGAPARHRAKLTVALPGVDSIAGLQLDVDGARLKLRMPGTYALECALPFAVDAAEADGVVASFSRKKGQLSVTLTQPAASAQLCGDLE